MISPAHQVDVFTTVAPHLLERSIGAAGVLIFIAIGLAYLIFFVSALLSVLGAPVGCGVKLIWFLVILCLPFLGSLLWFIAGRPRRY